MGLVKSVFIVYDDGTKNGKYEGRKIYHVLFHFVVLCYVHFI